MPSATGRLPGVTADLISFRSSSRVRRSAGVLLVVLTTTGCMSPYHTDQGALFGGVTGAGVGALVGDAVGNPLGGALIGGGVGALSGAAIGNGLDQVEARNRAQIAATLGRQAPSGAVSIADVLTMQQAGIAEDLIVTHVQTNGLDRPLQAADLITLQNAGVSTKIIQAMQLVGTARARATTSPAIIPVAGPPVIVEEHFYGPPFCYAPCRPRHPHFGWGFSVNSCD